MKQGIRQPCVFTLLKDTSPLTIPWNNVYIALRLWSVYIVCLYKKLKGHTFTHRLHLTAVHTSPWGTGLCYHILRMRQRHHLDL